VAIDLIINALLIPPAALFTRWYVERIVSRARNIGRIGQDMSQFEEE
jgi:hypothetical protein